jgi:hypothetical protein
VGARPHLAVAEDGDRVAAQCEAAAPEAEDADRRSAGAALGYMLLFLLLRIVVRKQWIAVSIYSMLLVTLQVLGMSALAGEM